MVRLSACCALTVRPSTNVLRTVSAVRPRPRPRPRTMSVMNALYTSVTSDTRPYGGRGSGGGLRAGGPKRPYGAGVAPSRNARQVKPLTGRWVNSPTGISLGASERYLGKSQLQPRRSRFAEAARSLEQLVPSLHLRVPGFLNFTQLVQRPSVWYVPFAHLPTTPSRSSAHAAPRPLRAPRKGRILRS